MLLAQSYLTLCDPMDGSLSGSSVRGILQARILEWVAMPSLGDLPNTGIKPRFLAQRADSLPSEHQGESPDSTYVYQYTVFIFFPLSDLLHSV